LLPLRALQSLKKFHALQSLKKFHFWLQPTLCFSDCHNKNEVPFASGLPIVLHTGRTEQRPSGVMAAPQKTRDNVRSLISKVSLFPEIFLPRGFCVDSHLPTGWWQWGSPLTLARAATAQARGRPSA
jgi:hypothetical protein